MLALRISYVARTQGVGNDHRNPGPAAALWSSYHYHTGMAVSALNDKMNRDSYNDDETFLCINDLISSEVRTNHMFDVSCHTFDNPLLCKREF